MNRTYGTYNSYKSHKSYSQEERKNGEQSENFRTRRSSNPDRVPFGTFCHGRGLRRDWLGDGQWDMVGGVFSDNSRRRNRRDDRGALWIARFSGDPLEHEGQEDRNMARLEQRRSHTPVRGELADALARSIQPRRASGNAFAGRRVVDAHSRLVGRRVGRTPGRGRG